MQNGLHQARSITRAHAATFYFASLFLPADQKRACYSIYAICRQSDASVDEAIDKRASLDRMRRRIEEAYGTSPVNDPLLALFRETVRTRAIPRLLFDDLLAGMEMDLVKTRYATFEELRLYCYRVAGVVGLMMARVFNATDPAAQEAAVDTGIAMQLTNILRDIREDYERGRLYLPQDELERFQVTEEQIASGRVDRHFKDLMRFEIERARDVYARGQEGLRLIADTASRRVAAIMAGLYAGILDKIEALDTRMLERRAAVPLPEKIVRTCRILKGLPR